MKTDRSAMSSRAAAALLAGFVLVAGLPAGGQTITIPLHFGGKKKSRADDSKAVASALAKEVAEVQNRFDKNRRALRTVQGPGGEPAYARPEVSNLIVRTGQDLDQAIARVQKGMEPLRDWSADEIRRLQEELAASARTAAASPGRFTPQPIAVVASLGWLPLPASVKAATAPQETVAAGTADRILDQVGEVISRIFVLADRDDLDVKLWVGSTPPKQQATFRFWSQGQIKGSTPATTTIRTNHGQDPVRVRRGLYSYRATLALTLADGIEGKVTELIQFPNPAGAPASDRLDLVNGTDFFCCQFGGESSCHHVANKNECRP